MCSVESPHNENRNSSYVQPRSTNSGANRIRRRLGGRSHHCAADSSRRLVLHVRRNCPDRWRRRQCQSRESSGRSGRACCSGCSRRSGSPCNQQLTWGRDTRHFSTGSVHRILLVTWPSPAIRADGLLVLVQQKPCDRTSSNMVALARQLWADRL